jgi:hypothetical protein
VVAAVVAALAVALWLGAGPSTARDWARMPWNLATIWWDFPPESGAFQSLSMDVEIEGEEVGERKIYVAAIGWEEIDGAPLYAGLQAGGKLQGGGIGHIGIFSRWNERDPAAIRIAPGGYSENAGYEGDFISVRHPVPWHHGRYRVSLTAEPPQGADPRPWIRAEVLEIASGTRWQIGALRFPGGPEVRLGKSFATFVEAFGEPIAAESVPKITVTFGNLRINDHPVSPTAGTAVYNEDVPPVAEAFIGGPGTVIVDLGRPHDRSGLSVDAKGRLNQHLRW